MCIALFSYKYSRNLLYTLIWIKFACIWFTTSQLNSNFYILQQDTCEVYLWYLNNKLNLSISSGAFFIASNILKT
jgi:hypothetical protein